MKRNRTDSSPTKPSDAASALRVEFPDHSKPLQLNRRDFLRVAGAATAMVAVSASGCQAPVEDVIPFVTRPEEQVRLGKPLLYASAIGNAPVLVRTREGRPIQVVPNPDHPLPILTSHRIQATLMDLYDPDRAKTPLWVRRSTDVVAPTSWEQLGSEAVKALKASKGKIALLTGPINGPGSQAIIERFCQAVGARHIQSSVFEPDALATATSTCFGPGLLPNYRFDRAKLIVGFGSEFLDFPRSMEQQQFVTGRDPDRKSGMSRFVMLEGQLTLTGANADQRIRVRPSQLPLVALAIANELIVTKKLGPLANHAKLNEILTPFSITAVSKASGLDVATLTKLANELAQHAGKSIVLGDGSSSSSEFGVELETALALINLSLGNYKKTIELHPQQSTLTGSFEEVEELTRQMAKGNISLLLFHGVNPVYHLPEALGFKAAISKVKTIISFSDRVDETSRLADYLAPASHDLESWGDVTFETGLYGIRQPSIRPLYSTFGLLDILIAWGAQAATIPEFKTAVMLATDKETEKAKVHSPAYIYLREHWKQQLFPKQTAHPAFDDFWDETLRKGFVRIATSTQFTPDPEFQTETLSILSKVPVKAANGLEVLFFPHPTLGDGSQNNNGWLLELPDPISRITWGSWLAIAPRRFDEMKLENGQHLSVTINNQNLTLPAFRQAGMHQDVVALPLGLGRTACGKIGNDIGSNAFPLLPVKNHRLIRARLTCTIQTVEGMTPLAIPQGSEVLDRSVRQLVPVTDLASYSKDPKAGTEQTPGGPSAWSGHKYEDKRWWMTIDLNRCIGCAQCVVACQAENNIPVVGKQGVLDGREMSWIRIDRYYDAPKKQGGWDDKVWDSPLEVVEEPNTLFEPMLCQHCENAPCETVCPFVATMHSSDGLNQQIYNRCVGTRYCSNNCPFKVRRFNWFEYSSERKSFIMNLLVPEMKDHARLNVRGKMQMKNNPEVTVRSRGVMEKCSFCIQRIREAESLSRADGKKGTLTDGEVVPACMEACPTKAIVFGDINLSGSAVKKSAAAPRAMTLLEATGVKPSISYLTKVRNET